MGWRWSCSCPYPAKGSWLWGRRPPKKLGSNSAHPTAKLEMRPGVEGTITDLALSSQSDPSLGFPHPRRAASMTAGGKVGPWSSRTPPFPPQPDLVAAAAETGRGQKLTLVQHFNCISNISGCCTCMTRGPALSTCSGQGSGGPGRGQNWFLISLQVK